MNRNEENERTLMGFFISAEYLHEDDDDPSAIGIWKVRDEVRDSIIANPLSPNQLGGYSTTASQLTMDAFENVDVRSNVKKDEISVAAKIDIQPVSSVNLTFGGTYNDSRGGVQGRSAGYRDFMRRYELFNWEHSPFVFTNVYRVYGRFTQRFGTTKMGQGEAADSKPSLIGVVQCLLFRSVRLYQIEIGSRRPGVWRKLV